MHHLNTLTRRNFLQAVGLAGAATVSFAPVIGSAWVRAQPAARMGRVFQYERGGVNVHTYIAPEASFLVTSHIIETESSLIVVDAQLLQTFAEEVRTYTDSLGKPIDRVILSHAHPDHFLGANLFSDVPFVSTAAIAEQVQAYIDAGSVAGVAALVGENEVPPEVHPVSGELELGDLTVDGVTLNIENVTNAEAVDSLVIRIPDAGVVVVQDLIYNNMHFFPGVDRANWITVLEGLRTGLDGYDTVLPGHGLPTTRGELDTAIQYLTLANNAVAETGDADGVTEALQAAYPAYEGAGILQFWTQFLQPA